LKSKRILKPALGVRKIGHREFRHNIKAFEVVLVNGHGPPAPL